MPHFVIIWCKKLVLIDLSDPSSVDIKASVRFYDASNVELKTNFKISRVFLVARHDRKQELKVTSKWLGDKYPYEYEILRPEGVIADITHFAVMGNPKQTWARAWPARYVDGLVLWKLLAVKRFSEDVEEDNPERSLWITLWADMPIDPQQLSLDFRPNRFDFIG